MKSSVARELTTTYGISWRSLVTSLLLIDPNLHRAALPQGDSGIISGVGSTIGIILLPSDQNYLLPKHQKVPIQQPILPSLVNPIHPSIIISTLPLPLPKPNHTPLHPYHHLKTPQNLVINLLPLWCRNLFNPP